MTHSTTVTERRNSGSYETVFATVDITSMDNADNEPVDLASELNLDEVLNISVGAIENPGSYVVQVAADGDLHVESYGAATDNSGTDIGTVDVVVDGNPSA